MNLDVLRLLPRLLGHVNSIRGSLERVVVEITELNAVVSRLEPQLTQLLDRIAVIETRTGAMESSMANLSQSLEGVNGALHPFQRGRGRRRGDSAEAVIATDPGPGPGAGTSGGPGSGSDPV